MICKKCMQIQARGSEVGYRVFILNRCWVERKGVKPASQLIGIPDGRTYVITDKLISKSSFTLIKGFCWSIFRLTLGQQGSKEN